MFPFRFYAATSKDAARFDWDDSASLRTTILRANEYRSREGHVVNGLMYVGVGPHDSERTPGGFDYDIYRTR